MKLKDMYWLIAKGKKTAMHDEKIKHLRAHNINAIILHDFDQFFEAYNNLRSSAVILGDEFPEDILLEGMMAIHQHPEMAGTRFIFSLSKPNAALTRKAILKGFRDVLPLDLNTTAWMERYDFATSAGETNYKQAIPQLTLRHIAGIKVPARVVWISKSSIRIEAKMKIPEGGKFKLIGGLADYLGVKYVTATVTEHQTSNLRYRFSDGYVCDWSIAGNLWRKKQSLLEQLSEHRDKAPHKAFVAISSYHIRHNLIKRLAPHPISIHVALHKNSLAEEPRFLNPDVVFIEEKLCKGKNRPLFMEMMSHIRKDVPVYILGREIDEDYFKPWTEDRSEEFIFMRRFTPNFASIVQRKLDRLNPHSDIGSAYYIRPDHPLSIAEISISARLTKLHPESAELVTPYQINNFGLVAIDSSMTNKVAGRHIYGKVTASFHHDHPELKNFPYMVDCYLSDLMNQERIDLSKLLVDYFHEHMNHQLPEAAPQNRLKAKDNVSSSFDEDKVSINPRLDKADEASLHDAEVPASPRRVKAKKKLPLGQRFASALVKYRRDFTILLVFIVAIIAFIFFIDKVRPPVSEQGKVYSDQLLKFQQRFQNDSE